MPETWNQDEIAFLKGGYAEGKTIAEIARTLKRSPNAVRNKAYELRLNPSTKKEQKEVEQTIFPPPLFPKFPQNIKLSGQCAECGNTIHIKWNKPLTETECNQLATLVCANKHPGEKVKQYGACIYCGQAILIDCYDDTTESKRNDIATLYCKCPQAEREARIADQISKAKERIEQLFGDGAEEYDFSPLKAETIEHLHSVIELIAHRVIRNSTVQVTGRCKAKISLTNKGNIKVERTETTKCQLEEE